MPFLKLTGVRVAFVALAVLAASTQTVLAETLFLTCGTYKFTVDLTNNTVNNAAAKINVAAIDWELKQDFGNGVTSNTSGHIDRIAGTYTRQTMLRFADGRVSDMPGDGVPNACAAGSQPAAKF